MNRRTLLRSYAHGRRDFRGVMARGIDLREARLPGADFSGADLTGADLCGGNLSACQFREATLCDVKMSGAVLVRGVFCWALMSAVIGLAADLREANFVGANLTDADLYRGHLVAADF